MWDINSLQVLKCSNITKMSDTEIYHKESSWPSKVRVINMHRYDHFLNIQAVRGAAELA